MVSSPTFLTILSQAARISSDEPQRPNVDQVVEALLQAEKSAKQERRTYQFDQLNGDWQLCFATGTRKIRQGGIALKKGYYLPKFASAQLSFSAKDNTIGNQAQLARQKSNNSKQPRSQNSPSSPSSSSPTPTSLRVAEAADLLCGSKNLDMIQSWAAIWGVRWRNYQNIGH
jgi:hypothetical protein